MQLVDRASREIALHKVLTATAATNEDGRRATGWRDRVREAAVRAEHEERRAREEEAREAREERAAQAAAEASLGGGDLAVDGRIPDTRTASGSQSRRTQCTRSAPC